MTGTREDIGLIPSLGYFIFNAEKIKEFIYPVLGTLSTPLYSLLRGIL
jgi:hypothetical protein